jgi:hypothetical protein
MKIEDMASAVLRNQGKDEAETDGFIEQFLQKTPVFSSTKEANKYVE